MDNNILIISIVAMSHNHYDFSFKNVWCLFWEHVVFSPYISARLALFLCIKEGIVFFL